MNSNDYAVVVGLSKYYELADPPPHLKGPENDERLITKWLTDPAGGGLPPGNVQSLTSSVTQYPPIPAGTVVQPDRGYIDLLFRNLNRIAIENQKARKGRRVGRRLYVYMSGHGFSPEANKGCLLTADAGDGYTNHVHASAWIEFFQDAGYFDEFVLWMDCCMDRGRAGLPLQFPPLEKVIGPGPSGAAFIAFAARRDQRAVEVEVPENGRHYHGAFTWELVQGLRGAAVNQNGDVTGRSLADWLRHAVRARLEPGHLTMPFVSQEPEIVKEDDALVFSQGIAPLLMKVALNFPPEAVGCQIHLWTGYDTAPAKTWVLSEESWVDHIGPGLYVVEVPTIGLRHGFQVTRDREIVVSERGLPVQTPARKPKFRLKVWTGSPSIVASIADAKFKLQGQRRGEEAIDVDLPFGVYKVRKLLAGDLAGRVVLLDDDVTDLDAPAPRPVASAAPLPGTGATHEYLVEPMAHSAAPAILRPHVSRGTGGEITIVARSWNQGGGTPGPKLPWEGVQIISSSGEILVDLSRDGERNSAIGDPFAICTLAVSPGSYALRQQLSGGRMIDQSLYLPPASSSYRHDASLGWRLEVYSMRQAANEPGESEPAPRISLLMRPRAGGNWGNSSERITQEAQFALAQERRVLGADLENLLLRKFDDPVAGIIGAHLLLLEHEQGHRTELTYLNEIVANLRLLVGHEHPDVEALSLHCPDPDLHTRGFVLAPPMFERSWRLLVRASATRRDLIPATLWESVAVSMALPPFFAWTSNRDVRARYAKDLAKAIWATSPTDAEELETLSRVGEAVIATGHQSVEPAAALSGGLIAAALPGSAATMAVRAQPVTEAVALARASQLQVPVSALDALRAEQPVPGVPLR